ncbi:MAG: methyltransferase FkbM [Magnetovibrio sp.]|nr:methyltransferase FkbM [Magnetovibrio sp.]
MTEMTIEEYEKLEPIFTLKYKNVEVLYNVPNRQTLWRAESLNSKEPDTLAWIDNFDAEDVLFDVGANVGMYSIWAAATKKCSVVAFEPEAQNYAILNKNIGLNNLRESTIAYPVALSDGTGFGDLHLSDFVIGGSCHTFGEALDHRLQPRKSWLRQGSFSTTIDRIISSKSVPFPTQIKIDVDGIEHKVIEGAKKTLKDDRVRSILVELNTNLSIHNNLIKSLERKGFRLWRETLDISIRKKGEFKGVGNHIFQRT